MSSLLSAFVHHYVERMAQFHARTHYDDSWQGIDRSNEVGAVRSYLMDKSKGLDHLNKTVAPLLNDSRFQVKFAGVFCHKKPIVQRSASSVAANPGSTPGCELGDLLVTFLLLDSTDQLVHLAGSLFQAKRHEHLDSTSQQLLYDADHDFVLPAYLGGHTRKMPTYAEGRGRALRYLILQSSIPRIDVGVKNAPWISNQNRSWANYLHGLLGGSDGLMVTPTPDSRVTSWDNIVRDLLAVAANVPKSKPPRGSDVAVQIATGSFNNFMEYGHWCEELEGEDWGVSTMMVIVRASEQMR